MLSRGTWASAESKNSTGEENIVVKLKEELDSARSERDDALFRLKQVYEQLI